MAIIQKIRDKYAKVAGGVIVIALVGFVLMDATSGGRSSLFGSKTTVAKVNGEKIDVTEYENMINAQSEQMKKQGGASTDAENAQLRDQVINQMIQDKLTSGLVEKLGISVSESELKEMLNPANPDPMVRQAFTDPNTKVYNAEQAAQAINAYEKSKDATQKAEWAKFKEQLKAGKIQSKLNSLLAGSYYTPNFVMKDMVAGGETVAKISYVNLPYTLVSDDKVKVTEDDVNKYIQSHKSIFEVKNENRSVDYVGFKIVPSAADSAVVRTVLDTLKSGLNTSTDIEAFVKRNSSAQLPVSYLTDNDLNQLQIANNITSAATGDVVGPFAYAQNMAIAKVLERVTLPDTVNYSRIVVVVEQTSQQGKASVRTEAQAQARIDSVMAQINAGVPFDSLIAKYSDDAAQNPTGADKMTIAQRGYMPKEMGDFVFNGAVGSVKAVSIDERGFKGKFLIKVTSKSEKVESTTRLALISKPLNASTQTFNNVNASASGFANKVATNAKNFDKEASAIGMQKQTAQGIDQNSYTVQGIGSSPELVKWAYNAKIGDVSPQFTVGGDLVVIAKLTEINAPGLLKPTGQMRMNLENLIRNQKKATYLMEQNKSKKSLEEIAAANQVQTATADSLMFNNPNIQGIGNEYKVVGYTFNKGFKENTLSPGIPGGSGLFYIVVNQRTSNQTANAAELMTMQRKMMDAQMKGQYAQRLVESLRKNADITDMRAKIYNRD